MAFFRALGLGAPKLNPDLRRKLPPPQTVVEVSAMGGRPASVTVIAVDGGGITTTAGGPAGAGKTVIFSYTTTNGKHRFASRVLRSSATQVVYALPKSIGSASGGDGKRVHVRLDTTLSGSWRHTLRGTGDGAWNRGAVTDLSRTGASLVIDRQLRSGTQVELTFTLNSASAPLVLLGEVMRVQTIAASGKQSHGLRFHGMTPEIDKQIGDFINRRQAERRRRGLV